MAYSNPFDHHYNLAITFFTTPPGQRFVLLDVVKLVFLKTYAGRLNEVADALVVAVNRTREDFAKSRAKTLLIKQSLCKKHLNVILEERDLHRYAHFLHLLMAENPILDLIDNVERIDRLVDTYVRNAREQARQVLTNVRNKLGTAYDEEHGFDHGVFEAWRMKIKRVKQSLGIFHDVDDEDVRVAANLLEYAERKR
ncbi:hypothetical protein HY642_00690 [Candidatus Woesearchaeota archaeon]|nr:hypothetical protein [Candidatus Woesearchaeota archaeon]